MREPQSFPVEELLEAITAQLDKTQDALRLKAVNRPLTFALKDFSVDLNVFVTMDTEGQVRFRPAAPNEEGASMVKVGFTTITRPMIEENTVSLEQTSSPSLAEAGLDAKETKQLERLGVRNVNQLERLRQQADDRTVSRMAGLNVNRLRAALQLARDEEAQERKEDEALWAIERPSSTIDQPTPQTPLKPSDPRGPRLDIKENIGSGPGGLRKVRRADSKAPFELKGRNLLQSGKLPKARLNGQPVEVVRIESDTVAFDLRGGAGLLEIEVDEQETEQVLIENTSTANGHDPWAPGGDHG